MSSAEQSRSPSPASHSTVVSTPPSLTSSFGTSQLQSAKSTDAFSRYRPEYHLQPPSGWMNDPCAPGYDPKTGLYHIGFQWNSNGPDWGEICWGSATSPDMVHWKLVEKPTLRPNEPYDREGVFTGCMIPTPRDDSLTCAYTSISALPIHHTLTHMRGSESLSLAKSRDGGRTWTKTAANPILPSEPEGIDVTGWRDPFVAPWSRMCDILELDKMRTLFGIISGGIRDLTPTTFLYAIDATNLSRWRYVSPLTNFGTNLRPSRWSGDLGKNWEVTNFLTLRDEGDPFTERDFLVMGTEGCLDQSPPSDKRLSRPTRGQLWMSGSLRRQKDNQVDMPYSFGGHLDHGCLYAANSFFDPQSQRQIVWGWVTEDDLCDELRYAQGWSGMLSLPRELRMQTLKHVVGSSVSRLEDITSIKLELDEYGSSTVRTLESQPSQRMIECLRSNQGVREVSLGRTALDSSATLTSIDARTAKWELDCSFKLSKGCHRVGLSLSHSADFSQATILSFSPSSETFTISRPSLPIPESSDLINSAPEEAPHTLFTFRDPATGVHESETLDIRAWRDNSVLEVFVNGRTAISTRLYAAEETFGMHFFAEDDAADVGGLDECDFGRTEVLHASLWDGIGTN